MNLPESFLRRPLSHRGLHRRGVPENSLPAFEAAIAAGYGIELDVQPSADGIAMAFHDDRLDRLTGWTGDVHSLCADDLSRLRLQGTDATVPRLSDVVAQVAGRVPLLVEIKDRDGDMGPAVGALEDATLAALEGYAGDVAVMSFNPHSVAYLARRAPDLPRGLVTAGFAPWHWPQLRPDTRDRLRAMTDLARLDVQFISHQADDLASPQVAAVKATGLPVLTWTIRSAAEETRARQIADGITFEGYLPEAARAPTAMG
jgi:glycerophosphoryl diester phosphodiesterase